MQIDLPDDIGLTAQEVKREIAIVLYQREAVSLAKAATISAMTRLEFQRLLASRDIPIHYDVHDLDADISHLSELGRLP